jgi:hypothetical protein
VRHKGKLRFARTRNSANPVETGHTRYSQNTRRRIDRLAQISANRISTTSRNSRSSCQLRIPNNLLGYSFRLCPVLLGGSEFAPFLCPVPPACAPGHTPSHPFCSFHVFRLFSCILYERSERFGVGLQLVYFHAAFIPLSIPLHTIILHKYSYINNQTQLQDYQYHNTIIMPIPFWKPGPAPPGALQAARQPLLTGNPLSQLFLQWLNPLLKIGYSRPLQIEGEPTGRCTR